jgi:enoyl-CoA hydratase/carnithine racemase
MSKPVIAAINGAAVGSGLQLALTCDIRIASDKARFCAGWIRVALDAASGGAYYLPRSIGLSNAFYMMYTADMIDAATALEWHLITKVVPLDELIPFTMELAKRIAKKAPIPQAMNRRLIYRALDTSLEVVSEWQFADRMICYHTEDHLEAAKAFLEKREPAPYKGR